MAMEREITLALVKKQKLTKKQKNYFKKRNRTSWKKDFKKNGVLYAMFLIPLTFFIVFRYVPMVGILMAFQDFKVAKGLFDSDWVGLANFFELFEGDQFKVALRNTTAMALFNLTFGFAAPIILGVTVAQVRSSRMSRTVQTITYMPYFVSAVVVTTLASEFLSDNGALTQFISLFGYDKQNWLANNGPSFWVINTFLGIWQTAGYGSIIYITAMKNISPDLYEAASMDGASRWKQIFHITLPSIVPLIAMLFTMRIGLVFVIGFDKVLLMYLPSTYEYSDVLYTYTYRMAFSSGSNFSLATASGLFQSVIGMTLLIVGNKLSRKITNSSLF